MFSYTLYDTPCNKFLDDIIKKYDSFTGLDVKSNILFPFNNISIYL